MNPSYARSDSWMGKSLVFIVVLVMVLTGLAVNGLINAPKRAVEAAGVQVAVDREAAELAAEVPGMPALAAARQARELEDIQRERERAARDWWAYQQAQDEQLRLTRAQNDLTIASGEWSLARRAQLSEWGIYLAAFAAAMSILLVSYVLKRVVDRRLPAPRPVALRPGRGLQAGEPVIIEGQTFGVERPLPVQYSTQRSPAGHNRQNRGATQDSPAVPAAGHRPHDDPGHAPFGFIGIPTGQPRREQVTGR